LCMSAPLALVLSSVMDGESQCPTFHSCAGPL
jgi:hypothetical protein